MEAITSDPRAELATLTAFDRHHYCDDCESLWSHERACRQVLVHSCPTCQPTALKTCCEAKSANWQYLETPPIHEDPYPEDSEGMSQEDRRNSRRRSRQERAGVLNFIDQHEALEALYTTLGYHTYCERKTMPIVRALNAMLVNGRPRDPEAFAGLLEELERYLRGYVRPYDAADDPRIETTELAWKPPLWIRKGILEEIERVKQESTLETQHLDGSVKGLTSLADVAASVMHMNDVYDKAHPDYAKEREGEQEFTSRHPDLGPVGGRFPDDHPQVRKRQLDEMIRRLLIAQDSYGPKATKMWSRNADGFRQAIVEQTKKYLDNGWMHIPWLTQYLAGNLIDAELLGVLPESSPPRPSDKGEQFLVRSVLGLMATGASIYYLLPRLSVANHGAVEIIARWILTAWAALLGGYVFYWVSRDLSYARRVQRTAALRRIRQELAVGVSDNEELVRRLRREEEKGGMWVHSVAYALLKLPSS
jgi:hypothetical protein